MDNPQDKSVAGFCGLVGHEDSGYLRHVTSDRMRAPCLEVLAPEKHFAGDNARVGWESQNATRAYG